MHPFLTSLDDADKVRFALSYPFAQSTGSFVYAEGRAWPLTDFDIWDWPGAKVLGDRDEMALMDVLGPVHYTDLAERRSPVLAVGSNASPEQLARKYAGTRDVIPTVRVSVADHAIVYAAHIAGYGSVPATLHYMPGARVNAFVNFLTDDQRDRMDATETLGRHYAFTVLHGADIRLEDGTSLSDVAAYVAIQGVIAKGARPLALAEVPQDTPDLEQVTQAQMAEYLRAALAPEMSLDEFVLAQIRDPALRQGREEVMATLTVPTRIKT
ncbi:MAG: hypothetical protein ACFB6R_17075 [Alphaproteobacteria bacterium]